MFALISILLLSAHLLCMNVSSAGPVLCIWLAKDKQQRTAVQLAERLALASLCLLLVGTMLGLLLGWTTVIGGDRRLLEVLPFFRRKIGWGLLELLCSLTWLLGYWAWLKWRPPRSRLAGICHAGLAVLSTTNLLYHFPPLLTVMSKAASGEIEISEPVDAAAFRSLFCTPNVLAHSLHFVWASFAVSGVYLFSLAKRMQDPSAFLAFGARIALATTVMQLPTGLWLVLTTSPLSQARLVGGEVLPTMLFGASVLAAFFLLQELALLAWGEASESNRKKSTWLLVSTVVMMTGTLHLMRA